MHLAELIELLKEAHPHTQVSIRLMNHGRAIVTAEVQALGTTFVSRAELIVSDVDAMRGKTVYMMLNLREMISEAEAHHRDTVAAQLAEARGVTSEPGELIPLVKPREQTFKLQPYQKAMIEKLNDEASTAAEGFKAHCDAFILIASRKFAIEAQGAATRRGASYYQIQTALESVETEFKLLRAMNLNHWTDVEALKAVTARFGKMARRAPGHGAT